MKNLTIRTQSLPLTFPISEVRYSNKINNPNSFFMRECSDYYFHMIQMLITDLRKHGKNKSYTYIPPANSANTLLRSTPKRKGTSAIRQKLLPMRIRHRTAQGWKQAFVDAGEEVMPCESRRNRSQRGGIQIKSIIKELWYGNIYPQKDGISN